MICKNHLYYDNTGDHTTTDFRVKLLEYLGTKSVQPVDKR